MLNTILAIAIMALGGYMMFAQLQKGKRCTEAVTAVIVGRETFSKAIIGHAG